MSSTMSSSMDDSARPNKRRKIEPSVPTEVLKPLPPAVLLLSLQSLLAHPPTHRNYPCSLTLTQFALRKCLTLSGLDYMTECRAWTELAEAGFRIGLDTPGIESELEKAITKALLIANKHPSLRPYKPRLTWLSANLASYRHNPKFAQSNLKDLLTKNFTPSDPSHSTYFLHLAYINSLSSFPDLRDSSHTSLKVFNAIGGLQEVALRNNHLDIVSLTMVLELRELLQGGIWTRLFEVLRKTEDDLNISSTLECENSSSPPTAGSPATVKNIATCLELTNFQTVLMVYTLVIGILFFTYVGDSANAQSRMKKLHEMLDGGALSAFGESGIVKVDFPDSPLSPFEVQVIHPRVLFSLGFLVSSVAKRDAVGRKPKRKMFAHEGVLTVEKELRKEASFPVWASISDVQGFQQRMHKIKADMICELIGVAITRSEYEAAERDILNVIAHTRSHGLFSIYSARITLHQAHLAHSLGQSERALRCYQVSAYLSRRKVHSPSKRGHIVTEEEGCEDYWANISARAGELWLRIGLANMIEDETEWTEEMEVLRKEGVNIVKECEGLGGTLQAVGAVLTACLSKEFLVAKTQFRTALSLSSAAQDNHLRALVFALVAAQYVHTSAEYAEDMLNTAEQLSAGLGAQPKAATRAPPGKKGASPKKKSVVAGDGVGNAHLRLWIGQRSLELKRRAGDEEHVSKQAEINRQLDHAAENLKKRKISQIS